MPRNQQSYTDEFREQIAKLVLSGKPITHIMKEYGIAKSTIHTWTEKYKTTGSFRDADKRSLEETELIRLRKENKQLKMEVDLITTPKSKSGFSGTPVQQAALHNFCLWQKRTSCARIFG